MNTSTKKFSKMFTPYIHDYYDVVFDEITSTYVVIDWIAIYEAAGIFKNRKSERGAARLQSLRNSKVSLLGSFSKIKKKSTDIILNGYAEKTIFNKLNVELENLELRYKSILDSVIEVNSPFENFMGRGNIGLHRYMFSSLLVGYRDLRSAHKAYGNPSLSDEKIIINDWATYKRLVYTLLSWKLTIDPFDAGISIKIDKSLLGQGKDVQRMALKRAYF